MKNLNQGNNIKQLIGGYLHKKFSLGSLGYQRFLRFLVVGASGLVVNNGVMALLTDVGDIHYLLSAVLATQCSTLWNFVFSEIWVFRDRNRKSRTGRIIRYFGMNNAALLLRGPLLTLFTTVFGIHYLISNLATLFLMAVIRFLLSDRWIWTPPMKQENVIFYYDIHEIVAIESWIRLPELEFFLVDKIVRRPDIVLKKELRRESRPTHNTVYYLDNIGRLKFECTINLGERTYIYVSELVIKSPHVLYTNIFEPVLRWVFVRKGYALLHGACIITDGLGIIVTAQTDTGKTSTILRLIENQGNRFLSDDMTLLGKDGVVLNFPKPLTISAHTMRALPRSTLNLREKLALQIQSRIHSRSGRKFALWLSSSGLPVATINAIVQILIPPPKFMIDRLIPEVIIEETASLSQIFQIERGPELEEPIEHRDIVTTLLKNADDAYGFPPYPQIADSLRKWYGEDLRQTERRIIEQGTTGKDFMRLRDPEFGWWKTLQRKVGNHPLI